MKIVHTKDFYVSKIAARVEGADVNDCVRWLGPVNAWGYGTMRYYGKSKLVHRVVLSIHLNKDVDHPMIVMHSCHNPWCINPEHLSYGTHGDNMADKVRFSRGALRKLTEEQVMHVRESTEPNIVMAKLFGVSKRCISDIRGNKQYVLRESGVARFIGGLGI